MRISNKLKELLKNYKNQKELAKDLDVSEANLCRWIREENTPTTRHTLIIDNLYLKVVNPHGQINFIEEV